MSERLLCPYCNEWVDFDTEDMYDEDNLYEVECGSCDKKFGVRASHSWSYYEEKVDCWNDGEHKWKNRVSAPLEYSIGKQMCEECGETREIPAPDWYDIENNHNHAQNWRNHE